jgi:D-methionine transport system substrate-binding protein
MSVNVTFPKARSSSSGRVLRVISILFILALLGSLLASCAPSAGSSENAPSTQQSANAEKAQPAEGQVIKIKVGASPVPHAEILQYIKDNLATKEGLDITIVEFTDYVQPNLALADGQIDANYFQHAPYMEDFAKEHKLDLSVAASVHIEPLGIYSKKVKSLTEVSDKSIVAIPNDATNGGRALQLLAANGLIKLKEGVGVNATVQDIIENPKNLQIKELEAAQLPRSLDDTTISVINGNFAIEAGFTPSKDALALESGENNPYANILAVVKGKENDPGIAKLVKLLTSPEVKQFIEEKYQGSVLPASQ